MTPQDCIMARFCAVAQERRDVSQHPDAKRSPSAVVPLARLSAVQGGGRRAF